MLSIVEMKEQMPTEEFAEFLKRMDPIAFSEETNRWIVTEHAVAKKILLDPRFSANRTPFFIRSMPDIDPHAIETFLSDVQKMMVMSDGKTHQNRRRICFHAFKPFMQQSLLPSINQKLDPITQSKT